MSAVASLTWVPGLPATTSSPLNRPLNGTMANRRSLLVEDATASHTQWAWLFATFFGAGYCPKGPGTAGSLAAILIATPLIYLGMSPAWFIVLTLVFLYPGIRASGIVAIESGRKDPQIVVVDEVLGQWLTLAGAAHFNWKSVTLGFVLFRFFDILKPPPGASNRESSRRCRNCARRHHGGRLRCPCLIRRRVVQSLLTEKYYGNSR